jgi:hypothetical protein
MKVRVMSMRYQGSQRVSRRADHVMSIFKTRIIPTQKPLASIRFEGKKGEWEKERREKDGKLEKGTD